MHDITLQINLSAGDVPYADLMVRALVRTHRQSVACSMAVVDCCRPQRTKLVDPDVRFPRAEFEARVARISEIAEALRNDSVLDEVHYLRPGDPLIARLSARYTNSWIRTTHDYGGCGMSSYFAGLDLPRTRFVIHYDADVVLYQASGYDWATTARALMLRDDRLVAATPRVAPPMRAPADDEQMWRRWPIPLAPARGGWIDNWFSTRCFLIDRERLERYLPLVRGRTLLELLLVRYLNRGYPRSPEILMFRTIGNWGKGRRLVLGTEDAWMIHPQNKPARYVELLPRILESVQRNDVPDAQRGQAEVDLAAWEAFLADSKRAPTTPTSGGRHGLDGSVPRAAVDH